MKITSKYLVVPVNLHMQRKKILLTDEKGTPVFDFDAYLDPESSLLMYLDVERFMGMELNVAIEPEMEYEFAQTSERPMAGVYDSYLRPEIHFTAAYGWLNDPNGLVYHDGVYHLFFQHNPAGVGWGNMHWGHATSPDLLHWTEHDIALFPDEMGAMFSGSGIVDKNNVSGLSPDGNTILFYYTAAGGGNPLSAGAPYTQCLAYSTDGGKTLVKYDKNPVVPYFVDGNRDPKVVWCEELDCYIMALYMEGDRYRLLESGNLLDWTPLQEIRLPDDNECPDLYPLECEGEKKWVLVGAHDVYRVGHFDKETRQLVFDSESKHFHFGNDSYAAQTYSDIPDRRVKIAWQRYEKPGTLFCGQMSVPVELSLVKVNGEIYQKACPVRELDSLTVKTETYSGVTTAPLSQTGAHDITIKAPKDSDDFTIGLFGRVIEVKPKENLLIHRSSQMPLSHTGGDIEIRLISDTMNMELFLDGGLVYASVGSVKDKYLNRLTVTVPDANITVKELKGIHA